MLGAGLIIRVEGRLVDPDSFRLDDVADTVLELGEVGLGKGIGLGNDRDKVDTGSEPLHDLDVEGLQADRIGPARQSDHRMDEREKTYVCPVGRMKYRQACTRMSSFSVLSGCCS